MKEIERERKGERWRKKTIYMNFNILMEIRDQNSSWLHVLYTHKYFFIGFGWFRIIFHICRHLVKSWSKVKTKKGIELVINVFRNAFILTWCDLCGAQIYHNQTEVSIFIKISAIFFFFFFFFWISAWMLKH